MILAAAVPPAVLALLFGDFIHGQLFNNETVATSLATQSAQQAGKRSDDALAVVRGERREAGQVCFATINSTPIENRRGLWSVIIFVFGFVISYFLIIRLGQSLLKAKSAMGDDDLEMSADFF